MVLNDSFSALFSSPGSLKKANDSFNESFGDKNSLSPATIFRFLQKEHDQISSVLKSHPPTTSQYQNSLNEIINLFERTEDQSTLGLQKLVLSVFLKLAANILSVLGKPTHQPTLYKLAQLIASSIVPDLGPENEGEEKTMRKWADRVVIECYVHLIEFPNYQLDRQFSVEDIVDDLGLASGRFQFVKSAIFEAARDIASEVTDVEINLESKFCLENLDDEHFLRLMLWLFLRQKSTLKGDLIPSLFSILPPTLNAHEYIKSSECSLLDLKLYIVSLSVVSSTTTESGMTTKTPLAVASQLSLTKHQKDCWKAVVDACAGDSRKTVTALARLRTSQLVESVRLITDGSEDVRVLFEAWKHCLQFSATHDDEIHDAINAVTEKYRNKMNSLLAYGPFYSPDPSSLSSSMSRRDMKSLFPLQFDYEFVNTTEAEHIGTVINSLEGYMSPQPEDPIENDDEVLAISDSFGDDTFHSFQDTSGEFSSGNNSQFFSPMKHDRESMLPSAVTQLIRDESIANSSHISTKSVILTPTRATASTHSQQKTAELSFELPGHPIVVVTSTSTKVEGEKIDSEDSAEDEEDELEAALLESTQRHEKSVLALKTPEKAAFVVKMSTTPTKDAQTETDDAITSSEESSIISVRYTPKNELQKKGTQLTVYSSDSEESEYVGEDEEDEYEEDEEEEIENEDNEDLMDESQMEEMLQQILEATTTLLRDSRMEKFGVESQKIKLDNATDDEILRNAEMKLAKINTDLSTTLERLEKLCISSVTTVFTPTAPIPAQLAQITSSRPMSLNTIDHDSKRCLGCQSDEVQESALRRLEQMAIEWDSEGNDYLFE